MCICICICIRVRLCIVTTVFVVVQVALITVIVVTVVVLDRRVHVCLESNPSHGTEPKFDRSTKARLIKATIKTTAMNDGMDG